LNLVKVAATAVPSTAAAIVGIGRHVGVGATLSTTAVGRALAVAPTRHPRLMPPGEPTGPAVLRGLIAKVSPTSLLWALLQRLPDVAEFTNPSSSKGSAE
jgi:hypothetical protein